MRQYLITFFSILLVNTFLVAQKEIKLNPHGPKENNGIVENESIVRGDYLTNISEPRMYYYPAPKEKVTGSAVLICPGGGYSGLSIIKEGEEIAKWYNGIGISAFVLYYRIPNGHCDVPMEDAFTALQIIHKNAVEWNINENKIGIMGFSAGGHLASTVGTHFKSKIQRPAFMILIYPVITMNNITTHRSSRNNLLGKNPSEKLVKYFSNEMQVTKKTPPTFIIHNSDDKVVPIENSIRMYKALQEKRVVAELDTFTLGGHGFGMSKRGIPVDNWPELLKKWLRSNYVI